MFDEFPNLKFVHTMLGGGFFAYADLITAKKSRVKEEMERFDISAAEKVKKYLQNNLYFDISTPGAGVSEWSARSSVGGTCVLGGLPVRVEW
jgi:hypothetical protein